MKRIVILIDGTWEQEGVGNDTNVGRLDLPYRMAGTSLIKPRDRNGIIQAVKYHKGVGTVSNPILHWLGGLVGEGRALVGLIGASGIVRSTENVKHAWAHYRVKPAIRFNPNVANQKDTNAINIFRSLREQGGIHPETRVKCVGVWETVGSYGVPAGFHLGFIARFIALVRLGFHDTSFGDHVDVGLHAVGIDEHRRPFVPTFWTIPKGQRPRGTVEQTWFAGEHGNVGGGERDTGLSNQALIWMIARLQALTHLEFDIDALRTVGEAVNIDGEVYDSTVGWLIDHQWPHFRKVLSPDAIRHGLLRSKADPSAEHINEKVHWSAIKKRGRDCTIYGKPNTPYEPPNLPKDISGDKLADVTPEEREILEKKGT
jgi:hypothetical protein